MVRWLDLLSSSLGRVGLATAGRGVLHPFIEPRNHLPEGVLGRLTREVAVCFIRKLHVAHDTAIALDSLVHALALDGEGAGIIVGHSVDEQNGMLDFVCL